MCVENPIHFRTPPTTLIEDQIMELPIAPVERIVKSAGIERISINATKALIDDAETYIASKAKKAYTLAQHTGRKTLREEDVIAASSL